MGDHSHPEPLVAPNWAFMYCTSAAQQPKGGVATVPSVPKRSRRSMPLTMDNRSNKYPTTKDPFSGLQLVTFRASRYPSALNGLSQYHGMRVCTP